MLGFRVAPLDPRPPDPRLSARHPLLKGLTLHVPSPFAFPFSLFATMNLAATLRLMLVTHEAALEAIGVAVSSGTLQAPDGEAAARACRRAELDMTVSSGPPR